MHNQCVESKCVTSCNDGLMACEGGCCSVAQLAVDGGMGCALKTDGSVWCWQRHWAPPIDAKALGPTPTQIAGLPSAREISVTEDSICALTDAGDITCVQPPGTTYPNAGVRHWKPRPVAYRHIYGGTISEMAAIDDNGIVDWAEGFNEPGESALTLTGTWIGFSVGTSHECGIRPGGSVWCLGDDNHGGGGYVLEGLQTTETPIFIPGLAEPVTRVASGQQYSCVLVESGGVKCWGMNVRGLLGVGDQKLPGSAVPLDVLGLKSNVASIAAGQYHACAITNDRHVICWGSFYCPSTDPEQAGLESYSPTDITSFFSAPVSSVVPGSYMICGILLGGGAQCIDLPNGADLCERTLDVYTVPGL